MILSAVLLGLLAAFVSVASAEAKTKWNYVYEVLDDGTAKILEYRGNEKDIVIPSELEEYPVTQIGDLAFNLRRNTETVTIPEGVVSIGAKAFSSCDGIVSIHLPDSLKSIGNRAFSNCKGLRSLELPGGIETLGENPFALCDNLKEVVLRGGSKLFEVRDGALIQTDEERIISYLHSADGGTYTVPADIRVIGDSAFVECKELMGIEMPEGLEIIEESAFNRCVSLAEIVLPSTVRQVGNRPSGPATP